MGLFKLCWVKHERSVARDNLLMAMAEALEAILMHRPGPDSPRALGRVQAARLRLKSAVQEAEEAAS